MKKLIAFLLLLFIIPLIAFSNNEEIADTEEITDEEEAQAQLPELKLGWEQVDNSWFYYDEHNQKVVGWELIDGNWYYFNKESGARESGWILDNYNWYFLDQDGIMQTDWVLDKNKWYFLNKSGAMRTGWVFNQNKWYFLTGSGAMKTGWVYDSSWYFLSESGAMKTGWVYNQNKWYFLDHTGRMKTGWVYDQNKWYHLNDYGVMNSGWLYKNRNWYLLGQNGAMKTGWQLSSNKWYYLKSSGEMMTGWYQVNSKWYYSFSSGILATSTMINGSYVNKDGAWIEPTTGYHYKNGILIVNKVHSLPSTYNPGENTEARSAFEAMKADAKKQGLTLSAFSTYRSYSYQSTLYNRYVSNYGQTAADTFSAKPGKSEHQTGLAFDIGGSNSSLWAEDDFAYTSEGKWLASNAQYYGFILRYPQGKEHITGYKYEPWHFRYVGVNLAKSITQSGLTLEEYIGEY
ncbi:D-alanyl-D-alanine carboxypeptidase family protein [Bacillus sp. JJ1566]|uniref:D-alanyl-D-alanine carboxypeptidase family protein n=1 Tax=Bacillus sp. JJ1566 TaxID=3122961 RepID=UPI003000EAD7